jgi:hypothetical protein
MPAVSQRQQRYMAMCMHDPKHARGKCPDMSQEEYRKFAETSRRGLAEVASRKGKKRGLSALRGR